MRVIRSRAAIKVVWLYQGIVVGDWLHIGARLKAQKGVTHRTAAPASSAAPPPPPPPPPLGRLASAAPALEERLAETMIVWAS